MVTPPSKMHGAAAPDRKYPTGYKSRVCVEIENKNAPVTCRKMPKYIVLFGDVLSIKRPQGKLMLIDPKVPERKTVLSRSNCSEHIFSLGAGVKVVVWFKTVVELLSAKESHSHE